MNCYRMRYFIKILFIAILVAYANGSVAQTNVIPDAVEFQALKNIYDSLGGPSWTTKINWPTPGNWPASATAAQMGTWFGITVTNGDISSLSLSGNNLTGIFPGSIA